MITSALVYIIAFIVGSIGFVLSNIFGHFNIWPTELLSGMTYFFQHLLDFNIVFPMDSLLQAIRYFVNFLGLFFFAKLVLKVFNYLRGGGNTL
jgi:hypothetical protein